MEKNILIAGVKFNEDWKQITIAESGFGGFFSFLKTTYSYDQIVSYEMIVNEQTIAKGGVGGALIGGILFGKTGAIVGAVTGRGVSNRISNMDVLITFRENGQYTVERIIILKDGPVKYGSSSYLEAYETSKKIISMLDKICENRNRKDNNILETSIDNGLEENTIKSRLKELKELYEEGLIDKEEYDSERKMALEVFRNGLEIPIKKAEDNFHKDISTAEESFQMETGIKYANAFCKEYILLNPLTGKEKDVTELLKVVTVSADEVVLFGRVRSSARLNEGFICTNKGIYNVSYKGSSVTFTGFETIIEEGSSSLSILGDSIYLRGEHVPKIIINGSGSKDEKQSQISLIKRISEISANIETSRIVIQNEQINEDSLVQYVKKMCISIKNNSSDKGFLCSKLIKSIPEIGADEEVFMGFDNTLFRDGNCGFVFTSRGIYWKPSDGSKVVFTKYQDIVKALTFGQKKNRYVTENGLILQFIGSDETKNMINTMFKKLRDIIYLSEGSFL